MGKNILSQRGISIIAAVFTLIILGIFGVAVVSLVSTEHELRAGQLSEDWAFYNVQAGLEFAIREIDQGGYPIVSDKTFGKGTFSVVVNYDEISQREIVVTGKIGLIQKEHQISYTPFGADCLDVNSVAAVLSGLGNTDLVGVTLQKICNDALTIDKIIISWEVNAGEKVTQVSIGSIDVWIDPLGVASGSIIDIVDTKLDTAAVYPLNFIRFTSDMSGVTMTIQFIMTDSSIKTESFLLP